MKDVTKAINHIQVPFTIVNTKEVTVDGVDYFEFEGYASTSDIDLYDDIVEPDAFLSTIKDRIPMLWQHDRHEPIGIFPERRIDQKKGLFVVGRMPKADTFVSGRVIPQVKIGSVTAMSIGFYIVEYEWNEETGIRVIKDLKLTEISLVTFPANPKAVITALKSGDAGAGTISAEDLKELSLSEIKYVIRGGHLSKNAASFLAGLVISGNRETGVSGSLDKTSKDDGSDALKKLHSELMKNK